MIKKLLFPVILAALALGFWSSQHFQVIAAGVAILLFGMLMMEDGFRLFSGGALEQILSKTTGTVPRALGFGFFTTALVQSSSLVSFIAISFLSAGLISLMSGVVIIMGADIGTTTGAWLVAGFGLKVNISAYALPLIALGIVPVFQKSKYLRGGGYILAGLGFLLLGIYYMKEGFDAFKDTFELTRFAMTGIRGLLVYTLIGAAATVVMQSSHATMMLTITALSAGQVSYDNALALTIGANVGTTVTAVIGSLTANFQGKRLALAHVTFKFATATVAIVLIRQFGMAVDFISSALGIAADDHTLKLAVFHTIFNVFGVVIILPLLKHYIAFLERAIPEPVPDVSQPRYLSTAVDSFPATMKVAMRKEVKHLQLNAIELIAHGLNLHRHSLYETGDIAATVAASTRPIDLDIDEKYETRVKTLYAAIVEFATRAGAKNLPGDIMQSIYALRDSAQRNVRAVKAVKHMRRNAAAYTRNRRGAATDLYNGLRTEIARILVEMHRLDCADPQARSSLWLDQERVQVERGRKNTNRLVEKLIRERKLDPATATSFLNDSGYAYEAMIDLIEAARVYYVETGSATGEVERILALEEDEIEDMSGHSE